MSVGMNIFQYEAKSAGKAALRIGFLLIIPFLAILIGWAFFAPLNSAALATGEVALNLERKTVQILDGGTVEAIHVRDGQFINKNDPILTIRDLSKRVELETLINQIVATRALVLRLDAEANANTEIIFDGLNDRLLETNLDIIKIKKLQILLFESRASASDSKIELIKSSKIQVENELVGFFAENSSINKQLEIYKLEFASILSLSKAGAIPINKKRDLEKTIAELEGKSGSLLANIARLKQRIIDSDLQILDISIARKNQILEEYQKNQLILTELESRYITSEDNLKRTIIYAPFSGRILDLQVHNKGAVIASGGKILDIVPQNEELIIDAKLNPNDVELVQNGDAVKVVLTAYKTKKVPKIDGIVLSVAPDVLIDEVTGQRYYKVRIQLDEDMIESLNTKIELRPGMQAQVFFIQGGRTLMDYIISPIVDGAYRAFREE
ncbi:MAG: HlyD family type I secretion periplasmic adaptor subunit [Alphaproteobacteria bacterium]|nr:HlyD family type I secretion periplasmic adaptor subunit [Alphaproteobacteria bacterium]